MIKMFEFSPAEKDYILSKYSTTSSVDIADDCNRLYWKNRIVRKGNNIREAISRWRKEHNIEKVDRKIKKSQADEVISNQLLIRENQNLGQALVSSRSINKLIVETVSSSISRIQPIKIIKPKKIIHKKHKEEVALLELSDWHSGERVIPKDVGNLSGFDFKTFTERAGVCAKSVIDCTEIIRTSIPVNKLVINLMGDIVTGENIFMGQSRSIDKILVDQVFDGAGVFAEKLFIPLLQEFSTIDVYCVWGNHGRTGRKGEYDQRSNWDYVLYRYLAERFRPIKHIRFFISESNMLLYKIPEIPEYTHLVIHGDQVRSASTPFFGLEKVAVKYVQMFNMPIHFAHCGHWHRPAQIDLPHGELIMNGSAVGGDDFTVNALHTANQPKQLFMGFNRKYGKTWTFELKLGELKQLKMDNRGIYTPINEESL